MQCNIDRHGKRVRLIGGIITTSIGVVLLVLTLLNVLPWWGWFITAGTLAGGLFQIFEGTMGWCAVRAMGFKTPI